jgi:glucan-binding YG repeat protein
MKIIMTTALAAAVLAAPAAHAQIYMCKDASGRTMTSDRPIPECADRSMREYGKTGVLKREIAAPLTAEEKRQKQVEEEKRKADAVAAAEQKKSDNAMLARYRNEADIEVARGRSLAIIDEQIKRETSALAEAEKQQAQSKAALDAAAKKQPKPGQLLVRNAEEAERRVAEGRTRLKDYREEHAKVNAKFDQTVKRFRELAGGVAAKGS